MITVLWRTPDSYRQAEGPHDGGFTGATTREGSKYNKKRSIPASKTAPAKNAATDCVADADEKKYLMCCTGVALISVMPESWMPRPVCHCRRSDPWFSGSHHMSRDENENKTLVSCGQLSSTWGVGDAITLGAYHGPILTRISSPPGSHSLLDATTGMLRPGQCDSCA